MSRAAFQVAVLVATRIINPPDVGGGIPPVIDPPPLPDGFAFLVDDDGAYFIDDDGSFFIAEI